jgi:anti-sigma factor RsiW
MSARKCDCSEKLVAWLDGELSIDEAAYLEKHLGACHTCRTQVDAYKKVSVAVQSYCEAATTSGTHRAAALRVLPYVGAAAAAAAIAFFLLQPHPRPRESIVQPAPAIPAVVVVPDAKPASLAPSPHIKPVRVRRSAEPPQSSQTNSPPAESAVQIAIPAEALFPPGAFPQGVAFVADLSIAPDGSPQRLHLEPQLIQFERSR